MRLIRSILALLAVAAPLLATTVSGTVTDAQGNNLTGTAVVSWPSFIEPGGELVVAGSVRVAITDGALSVAIAPNVGSTPSGTSYAVRIKSSNGTFATNDTWVVPNASTATIADVRTSSPPTPSAFISLTAISTAGVSVGDILTAQSGPTWARLAAGAEGEVLSIVSGVPAWAVAAASGTSINIEENNTEVIAAADLTGIDFLDADFDITDDANEANVAIAAGLTRDTEWDSIAEIETATGYDFSAAGNLTDDIAAARMSANWGAAGTDACATSGGVMFDNGTTVGCDADFVFNGDKALLGTGATKGLWFGDGDSGFAEVSSNSIGLYANGNVNAYINTTGIVSNTGSGFQLPRIGTSAGDPAYQFQGDSNLGMYRVAADTLGFSAGGILFMSIGGDQTALIKDTTPTTGVTTLRVDAGAGQGVSSIFQVRSDAGSVYADFKPTQIFMDVTTYFGALTLAGSRASAGNGFVVGSAYGYLFSSTSGASGSPDVGLLRDAPGVVRVSDGSTGGGRIKLLESTPSASTDACTEGGIWVDDSYIYRCIASGNIGRLAWATGW